MKINVSVFTKVLLGFNNADSTIQILQRTLLILVIIIEISFPSFVCHENSKRLSLIFMY